MSEKAFAKIPGPEPETEDPNVNLRQTLQRSGFVRVDGLTMWRDGKKVKIRRSFSTSGKRWELWTKNEVIALRSPRGEVWVGLVKLVHMPLKNIKGFIRGKSFPIPLSNGERITDAWDVYRRVVNPDWDPESFGAFMLRNE